MILAAKRTKIIELTLLFLTLFGLSPALRAEFDPLPYQQLLATNLPSGILKIEEDLAKAEAENNDQNIIGLLRFQTDIYGRQGNLPKQAEVGEKGLVVAKRAGDKHSQAVFQLAMADAYAQMNRWEESKAFFKEAIATFSELERIEELLFAKNKFGLAHYYNQEFGEGLEVLSEVYEQTPESLKMMRSGILSNIALIYEATGNVQKAIDYHLKNLSVLEPENVPAELSIVYYNLGYSYLQIEDYANAKSYLEKSEKIARELNIIQGLAFVASQLGRLNQAQKNYEASLKHFRESYIIAKQLNNPRLQQINSMGLMKAHIEMNNLIEAESLISEIRSLIMPSDEVSLLGLKKLTADLMTKKGEHLAAIDAYDEVVEGLQKSIKKINESKIQEMQAKFSGKLQAKENEILKQKNKVQHLEITSANNQRLVYFLSFLILSALLISIAIILRKEKNNRRRFAKMALTDELTGVANRRSILEHAEAEFETFKAEQQDITIAMIDLDHFKSVNDKFGHDVGDLVLKHFANAVKQVIRDRDRFGRVGGEEWFLIMPNSSADIVPSVFERMKEEVLKIDIPQLDRKITFSMGVTQYTAEDKTYESAAKRADECLYKAKENGRDRFEIG